MKKQRVRTAYVRFETNPGLQAQVDFADFKVSKRDGSEVTHYPFAMVLGYSRALYAELTERCTMQNFLEC